MKDPLGERLSESIKELTAVFAIIAILLMIGIHFFQHCHNSLDCGICYVTETGQRIVFGPDRAIPHEVNKLAHVARGLVEAEASGNQARFELFLKRVRDSSRSNLRDGWRNQYRVDLDRSVVSSLGADGRLGGFLWNRDILLDFGDLRKASDPSLFRVRRMKSRSWIEPAPAGMWGFARSSLPLIFETSVVDEDLSEIGEKSSIRITEDLQLREL